VDAGGRLVGLAELFAMGALGALLGPPFEHQLQRPHALVGGGDLAAGLVGLSLGGHVALVVDHDLDLAPVEQTLEVAEGAQLEWRAGRRPLGGVHLLEDGVDAGLGLFQALGLFGDGTVALGEHGLGLVHHALALLQGGPQAEISLMPPRH
jgi:hypothetical protein